MRTIQTLSLCLLLSLAGTVLAQNKAGTTTASFLELSASARGMAMADALLPIADDVSALYYNPAGLTLCESSQYGFTHMELPVDVRQEWFGYVRYLEGVNATIGFSATHLHTDQMDETTPWAVNGTGRTFGWTSTAVGLSAAKRLTNKFSTGLTVKWLRQSAMEENSDGWAADVGTYYDTGWRNLKVAMIISNFGPDMKFFEEEDPLPILFKFGVSMYVMNTPEDDHFVLGSFEFGHPSDNIEQINLGFEYVYNQDFAFRLGKKINGIQRDTWDEYQEDSGKDPFLEYPLLSMDGFAAGFGYTFHSSLGASSIDVAWTPNEFLEDYFMVTLSLNR